MFYYLDGTVAEILPGLAVIDCGGVGYACMTTNNTLSQLKKGEKKKLYTYLNVGESIFDLYGFATQNELNSFKLLLGVSGVGPKAALAILSANTPEGLAMAIVTEDAKSLTAAQGIGKKIAQRIILELKDKMAKETASGLDFSGGKGAAVPAVFTSKATEAAAALAVLGYSTQEVQMALKGVDVENLPLEEIIRQALENLPATPINLGNKLIKIQPGQAVCRHEAPRGQLSHMVVGDGSFNNHRVSIHVPSYKNTPTIPFMLRGNTVADAGLIIASIDPCFSCLDR